MKERYQFSNNIVFNIVMQDEEICRDVLQRIFSERKIGEVHIGKRIEHENEKTIVVRPDSKFVRMDVYFEDEDAWYDVEMQIVNEHNIGLRARYIQGINDVNVLKPGMDYNDLKRGYVIFICHFDSFEASRPIYYVQSADISNPQKILPLDDGRYTIILNTKSKNIDVTPELKALINYISSQEIPNNDKGIQRIEEAVIRANLSEELEGMMTYEEEFIRLENKIRKLEQGMQAQQEQLEAQQSETVKKLKAAGIDSAVIADCTGMTIEQVESL